MNPQTASTMATPVVSQPDFDRVGRSSPEELVINVNKTIAEIQGDAADHWHDDRAYQLCCSFRDYLPLTRSRKSVEPLLEAFLPIADLLKQTDDHHLASWMSPSPLTFLESLNAPWGELCDTLMSAFDGESGFKLMKSLKPQVLQCLDAALEHPPDGCLRPNQGTAVAIMMSYLPTLFDLDAQWTKTQLLPHLKPDSPYMHHAANGLIDSQAYEHPEIMRLVEADYVELIKDIDTVFPEHYDFPQRSRHHKACGWLLFIAKRALLGENSIEAATIKQALREFSDAARGIWLLEARLWLRGEEFPSNLIVDFINQFWPPEDECQTSLTSYCFLKLILGADDAMPAIHEACKPYIRPLIDPDHVERVLSQMAPATECRSAPDYPGITLDLAAKAELLDQLSHEELKSMVARAFPANPCATAEPVAANG